MEINSFSVHRSPPLSTKSGMRPSRRRPASMTRSQSTAEDTATGPSAVEADGNEVPIPTTRDERQASIPLPIPDEKGEDDGTLLSLDRALEVGVNRALRGDGAILRQVLDGDAEWIGPLGRISGLQAIEKELRDLGKLLLDPRISIFSSKNGARELEWVASGTWPLPWRPRFIVRGKSNVKTCDGNDKASSSSALHDVPGGVASFLCVLLRTHPARDEPYACDHYVSNWLSEVFPLSTWDTWRTLVTFFSWKGHGCMLR